MRFLHFMPAGCGACGARSGKNRARIIRLQVQNNIIISYVHNATLYKKTSADERTNKISACSRCSGRSRVLELHYRENGYRLGRQKKEWRGKLTNMRAAPAQSTSCIIAHTLTQTHTYYTLTHTQRQRIIFRLSTRVFRVSLISIFPLVQLPLPTSHALQSPTRAARRSLRPGLCVAHRTQLSRVCHVHLHTAQSSTAARHQRGTSLLKNTRAWANGLR